MGEITKTTCYVTSDGQHYANRQAAQPHQRRLNQRAALREFAERVSWRGMDSSDLTDIFMDYTAELIQLLQPIQPIQDEEGETPPEAEPEVTGAAPAKSRAWDRRDGLLPTGPIHIHVVGAAGLPLGTCPYPGCTWPAVFNDAHEEEEEVRPCGA